MTATQKGGICAAVSLCLMLMLAMCGTPAPTREPVSPVPAATSAAPTGEGPRPGTAREYFQQGNEFNEDGQFEQAVEAYNKVLELEPQNVDAMAMLGVAYYNLGQLDQAVEQYLRAIEIAPGDAGIHSNLAAAYVQKYQQSGDSAQLDQALAEYQKAVELTPSLAQPYYGLGVIYLLQGRDDDALQAFETFLDLDSGQDAIATANAKEYVNQLRGQ